MTDDTVLLPVTVSAAIAQAKEKKTSSTPRWVRIAGVLKRRTVDWCREDGYWYLTSMGLHAAALVVLAFISLAIPHAMSSVSKQETPVEFKSPVLDAAPPAVVIPPYEMGKKIYEPSHLDVAALEQRKADKEMGLEAKYYNDEATFGELEGSTLGDLHKESARDAGLGGLAYANVHNLTGPAIEKGYGLGPGTRGRLGNDGYDYRNRGHRDGIPGSTRATDRAVVAALDWIVRHQCPDGHWSFNHQRQCKGHVCSGPGGEESDVGATSLALLPLLGVGQTQAVKGLYQSAVARGITWLMKQQTSEGEIVGNCRHKPMYTHALAAIVLCEDYGMTHEGAVGSAARRAIKYIELAQNESTGGWRYHPGDTGDTSVFGWQIMALKSARMSGMAVESTVWDNAQKWLRSVGKGEHLGLYSYQPYDPVTPSMTAVGLLCRQYLGADPKDLNILESKRALLENLPNNEIGRDTYYWYYATLAMHNFSDGDWDKWNRVMRRVLIDSQDRNESVCAEGSWDPAKPSADAWGPNGGRLMTTCLNTLTLEVYYRYLPLFRTDELVPTLTPTPQMGFVQPAEEKGKKPKK